MSVVVRVKREGRGQIYRVRVYRGERGIEGGEQGLLGGSEGARGEVGGVVRG